jgi:hypothetical protein
MSEWKSFLRGHHPMMDTGLIGVVNPPDPSASGRRSVHDDVGAGYPLGGVVLHPGPRDRKQ